MKVIVISGAESGVGKTALVNEVASLLGDRCVAVKIGHGEPVSHKNHLFFHCGVQFKKILDSIPQRDYLIIESNSILTQIQPDVLLYIDSDNRKPSARLACELADIRSGRFLSPAQIDTIREKSGLPAAVVQKIIWLTGARSERVQGVLLAGGKSSRMGTDKAFLPLGKSTISRVLIDTIQPFCDDIVISMRNGKSSPVDGFRIINDLRPDRGPLMGIYSTLCTSDASLNLFTPCDIPFISRILLRKMFSYSDDFDIVIPSFKKGFNEPLPGIYNKRCLTILQEQLSNNQLRISDLFSKCRTKIVEDFEGSWYANLNTPEEYQNYCKGAIL